MIEIEEEWKGRVAETERRLKEAEEQLKKERQLANERLHDAKRALHKRSEVSSARNGSMDVSIHIQQVDLDIELLPFIGSKWWIIKRKSSTRQAEQGIATRAGRT